MTSWLQGTAFARGQLHCRDTAEPGRRRVGPTHADLSAKAPPALPCQACLARRRRRDVGGRQRGRRLRVRTGTRDAPPPPPSPAHGGRGAGAAGCTANATSQRLMTGSCEAMAQCWPSRLGSFPPRLRAGPDGSAQSRPGRARAK